MDSLDAAPLCAGRSPLGRSLIRRLARTLARSLVWGLARECDRCLVLQLVEAAGGDDVTRIDAVHLGQPAVCNSRGYAVQVRDIVLNHIYERRLAILLNR